MASAKEPEGHRNQSKYVLIFFFTSKSEMARAISGKPCMIYDRQPLVLQKWRESLNDDEKAFSKT